MKVARLIIFGGLFVGLALVLYFGPSHNEKLISFILSHSFTTDDHNNVFGDALVLLLRGTEFEGRWQINKQPRRQLLNVYILRSGLNNTQSATVELEGLLNNCSYIGESIIICDIEFVNSFLSVHRVEESFSNAVRESKMKDAQRSFLIWILGHEVGHALNRHSRAHFSPNELDTMIVSSSLENRQEFEADLFLVRSLYNDEQTRVAVETMLIDLLNAEIRTKVGRIATFGVGILYDYSDQKIVEYARRGTHPEFVVRLTRMLQMSFDASRNEGMKSLIDGFARHLKEASNN